MNSIFSIRKNAALLVCFLAACAPMRAELDGSSRQIVQADDQAKIWTAGVTCYAKGQYLAAADLLQLAYRLKPASRISQNIGMAYLRAAQDSQYPELLRLEYVRRALPHLRSYRSWLTSQYSRTHSIGGLLAETNQQITDSERLERELRMLTIPSRTASN